MNPSAAPEPASPCGPASGRRMCTLLVVDDDAKFLARIRSWLTGRDFAVICAETSESALRSARSAEVNLALIDYLLRGQENGLALARTLHREHRIPFIIISRYLETPVTVQAMKLGACDVLDKPQLTADGLLKAIDSAFRTSPVGSDDGSDVPTRRRLADQGHLPAEESAAKRLSHTLLRACGSKTDPRTVSLVARAGGKSLPAFRTMCTACLVLPHNVRDLVRMLRAISLSIADGSTLLSHLSFGDDRTVEALFERARLSPSCRRVDLRNFFLTQRFISTELEVMDELAHAAAGSPLFQHRWENDSSA